ncbi:hypothetical protein PAXRUDRAFT_19196 [Paxillus rubicundulus Ve08.2h10]|uniref:Uncharacterized protein n=1 Tax=Paxillus rubicundulus Ve08.2h10 TaxID=930991 RepID=A0A0D0D573_9AGAM|nr:hypothetical protein PAXRUDRAFT_19196 [Paxillus rubicundulus Ve08.2h10]
MPTQPEHQQLAETLIEAYLASVVAESHELVDPPTSSSSDSDYHSNSTASSHDESLPTPSESILGMLGTLYSRRYLVEHQPILKSGGNLRLLLMEWKHNRPEIFWAHVRITPECFDVLLAALQLDPVFQNQSNVPQMAVDAQLAITL